jgi:hypothetical protein
MSSLSETFRNLGESVALAQQRAAESAAAMREHQANLDEATLFLAEVHRASMATAFRERLIAAIKRFDDGLDSNEEVGMRLVSFGQTITFHVEDIHCHNPSLLFFLGVTDAGQRVQLVQHVSQLSFLLIALPRRNPTEPKKPFGFQSPQQPKAGQDGPEQPTPSAQEGSDQSANG